jgi:hypothetical protein
MPKQRQRYAVIGWCAADVLEHVPGWTRQQCNDFLEDNEDDIQLAMIEAGNAAIRELLPTQEEEDA